MNSHDGSSDFGFGLEALSNSKQMNRKRYHIRIGFNLRQLIKRSIKLSPSGKEEEH
jgi:hypothetical protein